MARKRVIPNLLYSTVGLAAVGTVGYFVYRFVQKRRLEGDDTMMAIRRSTRDAGRAVKDTAQKIGKETKRGASDVGDSVTKNFESPASTSYNRV